MFRIFINVVFQFYAIYCGYVNENCLAIAVTEKKQVLAILEDLDR